MVLLLSVRCRFVIVVGLLLPLQPSMAADGDRHTPARALLVARCVECHGADAHEGGLRLDSRGSVLRVGEYGPVAPAGSGNSTTVVGATAGGEKKKVMAAAAPSPAPAKAPSV